MKRSYVSLLILLTASLLSACGSSNAQKASPTPTPSGQASSRSAINSNVNSTVGAVENRNSRVTISNAGPPTDAGTTISSNSPSDRLRSRQRERVDADPTATPPPPTFQPAPENSEFAAQMEKDGGILETRVFKSHPQLKKVEIRWVDPKRRSLKVMLKNGKIVERQAVSIANLRTVSSTEILNIIGIRQVQK